MALYTRIHAVEMLLRSAEGLRPDFLKEVWELKGQTGKKLEKNLLGIIREYTFNRNRNILFFELRNNVYRGCYSYINTLKQHQLFEKQQLKEYTDMVKEASKDLKNVSPDLTVHLAKVLREKVDKAVKEHRQFKFECKGWDKRFESKKDAKRRIKENFKEEFDGYFFSLDFENKNYLSGETIELNKTEVFSWTVRRLIGPREKLDTIAKLKNRKFFDTAEISKETNKLANFLDLKIKPLTKQTDSRKGD